LYVLLQKIEFISTSLKQSWNLLGWMQYVMPTGQLWAEASLSVELLNDISWKRGNWFLNGITRKC